ncbi:MAG: murein biosynthesis integral membrane protein MurJ [candidate division Zixibacteria bacterium]|nr:murein biosynthesis integral membrane protein MurJ [candidate division Zixibacteria bacterium]
MSDPSRTIKRATIGIALIVLVSKAIGFVREMVIAYHFGTNPEYDVYLVAVSIPIAFFALVSGLSNLIIPVYSKAAADDNRGVLFSALWKNINTLLGGIIIITLSIIVFSEEIIRFSAPGFTSGQVADAAEICRIASIIIVMGYLETFFRSALNCEKQFFLPAAGPIGANIVFIAIVLLFSGQYSTHAVMIGLVSGYAVQMLVVFLAFRSCAVVKFFKPAISFFSHRRFYAVAVIILLIEAASQLYTIIDRYFASSLPDGVISALGYTYILFMLPVSVFAYALSTAIFPYLSDSFVKKDNKATSELLSRGISITLLLSIPIGLLFWVFSREIVILVFQRGAFDAQSAELTARLLKYFALGITGHSLITLMYRAYYAANQYKGLILSVLAAIGIKIGLVYCLIPSIGDISLAISSSVSYSVSGILLMSMSGRYLAPIDWKRIFEYFIKISAAVIVGYFFASYLQDRFIAAYSDASELIWRMPAVMIITVIVMGLCGYILRLREVLEFTDKLMRKSQRR